MMDLQKLLLPSVEICTETNMYFHSQSASIFSFGDEFLTLKKNEDVVFDTYFNSFSIGKWRKYTSIQNLFLSLDACGEFDILLKHAARVDVIRTTTLHVQHVLLEQRSSVTFEFPMNRTSGIYYFEIRGRGNGAAVYGGRYFTDLEGGKLNDIRIGLAICTFKREDYIRRNMAMLNRAYFQNQESPLYGRIAAFISDNAKSLNRKEIENEFIHVYPNINSGGTGGFSRALMELLSFQTQKPFTHVIFTDDDITFEPDIFARVFAFLSCLKPEFGHCSLGGSTLRLEKMNIQHTSGDCWNGGLDRKHNVKARYDLSEAENVLKNEYEEQVQFNAWTFSCVPVNVIKKMGMPLPIFIHADDVEYGIRNGAPVIHLNGVGIWHSFGQTYPGPNYYYDMRNALIVNAIHYTGIEVSPKRIVRYIRKRMIQALLRFRYNEADLMFRGVEDFCKGIDWLKVQDPVELHTEVKQLGHRMLKSEELPEPVSFPQFWASTNFKESKLKSIYRKLTLNGWIGRSKRVATVSLLYSRPMSFFRIRKAIQYNPNNDSAIVTEKSYSELLRVLKQYLRTSRLLYKKMAVVSAEYHERYQELITEEFWRSYLKLDEKPEERESLFQPKGKLTIAQKPQEESWLKKHMPRIWNKVYQLTHPYPYSYRAALDTHLRILGCWVLKKLHCDSINLRMRQIQQAKDRHVGDRCFIIGLGPSLRIDDLERLNNEYTFAANGVFLLFDRTDWRPTYYCRMDQIGSQRMIDNLPQRADGSGYVLDGHIPLREAYLHSKIKVAQPTGKERYIHINHGNHTKARMMNRRMKRSDDIDVSIYEMYTVTVMEMEIAMYMGFKEIYLLGVDCNYANPNGKIHMVETPADDNIRHSLGRQRLQNYTTSFMQDAFSHMGRVAKEKGVRVYNATRGGALEAFERIDFDSIQFKKDAKE